MKKFYWIESTMKIPNLHNEAVQCQIFKALNVFCSSNLSIIFFVSIEFYDNQHENSHAVRGCGACLGIRAWRRILWMVCYIIKQIQLKVKNTCFKSATFCCFTQTRTLKIWKCTGCLICIWTILECPWGIQVLWYCNFENKL